MLRVAIIDDAVDNVELIQMVLADVCGSENVSAFLSGEEFLTTYKPQAYDIVLLDLAMPGINGYEVLERIREVDSATPVIAFTAHAEEIERTRALDAGFADFITKPVLDMDKFCATVRSLATIKKPWQ